MNIAPILNVAMRPCSKIKTQITRIVPHSAKMKIDENIKDDDLKRVISLLDFTMLDFSIPDFKVVGRGFETCVIEATGNKVLKISKKPIPNSVLLKTSHELAQERILPFSSYRVVQMDGRNYFTYFQEHVNTKVPQDKFLEILNYFIKSDTKVQDIHFDQFGIAKDGKTYLLDYGCCV